ncbi:MAG: FG-GAP repeat protein, partial [Myxococcales bacterium]|nr:FG-GAP repeat protein [Myxococcales bacterium]
MKSAAIIVGSFFLFVTFHATVLAQNILFEFTGDSAGDRLGWSVGGGRDLDGDGVDDLIAGAPLDDDNSMSSGMARVYSGADGTTHCTVRGDSVSDVFGWSAATIPDIDGDGRADFVIGAPFDDSTFGNEGSARFFSGADCTLIDQVFGGGLQAHFGDSLNYAGDVNDDGVADVIVGAPQDDQFDPGNGFARVLSGSTRAVLYTFNGAALLDRFGAGAAGAGDVDNDGYDDVIVGAPRSGTGGQSGYAVVYSGRT